MSGAYDDYRHLGELTFAIALAMMLLAVSTLESSIASFLFCCGLVAWTFAEYVTHRFVLHAIAPVQHGIHHGRPQDAVDKVFWQMWLAFAVVYLTTEAPFWRAFSLPTPGTYLSIIAPITIPPLCRLPC